MKAILLSAGILLASFVNAQISTEVLYDFQTQTSFAVVSTPIRTLTHVAGKYSVELVSYAGADQNSTFLAGIAALGRFKVADQLDLRFGPALQIQSDHKKRIGAFIGFAWRV